MNLKLNRKEMTTTPNTTRMGNDDKAKHSWGRLEPGLIAASVGGDFIFNPNKFYMTLFLLARASALHMLAPNFKSNESTP